MDRPELQETFADLLFSVELTKGVVHVDLGVTRVDHRRKVPVRNSVPVARLILSNGVARELAAALNAAVENMDSVTNDDMRAAITLTKPATN